jgi:hypothetical protein
MPSDPRKAAVVAPPSLPARRDARRPSSAPRLEAGPAPLAKTAVVAAAVPVAALLIRQPDTLTRVLSFQRRARRRQMYVDAEPGAAFILND